MKLFGRKPKRTLEKEIESILFVMQCTEPGSPEYKIMAENLELLYKSKELNKRNSLVPAVIGAGASIGTVIIVVTHESLGNIITTKALQFVHRSKV